MITLNLDFHYTIEHLVLNHLSPPHTSALVARTCYSPQVGSTKFPRVRATFTSFSSFVICKPNIKHVWYFSSFVTKKFSCAASKRQARLNTKICACVQLAELKTTWRIKITSSCVSCFYVLFICLIFGLHVTNDENAVNVARTRGNFVDPTCHE
jgi:hypothetical protein